MRCYVAGVNGSGKTTLLKATSLRTGIPYIHGTSLVMERLGIAGNYDALRALNQDYVLKEWQKTAEQIAQENIDAVLLDAHILNLTKGNVIHRDGPWMSEYDALIIVTAPPSDILQRITKDTARERALFAEFTTASEKLQILTAYQAQTMQLAKGLSRKYGMLYFEVTNTAGSLEDAVDVLTHILAK